MPWSDDDDFESADEGSHDGSSTHANDTKKQSVNSDHNLIEPLPSSVKEVKATAEDDKKTSDGWEDFEDNDDTEPEPKLSAANIQKKTEETAEPKSVSTDSKKEQDTGWDFDDWGEEDTANVKNTEKSKAINQNKPSEPDIKSIAERLSGASVKEEKEKSGSGGGGWGWGGWGVDFLLSTATARISTITNHVSQGINTVLETSIGAPDPEELARHQQTRASQKLDDKIDEDKPKPDVLESKVEEDGFQFGSLLSGVTKFVESTGNKVIAGGLDTLETIGKKTMEVLQDGDPGLVKKRALLGLDSGEKVVLSQVLREAKSKADEEDRLKEEKREAKEVHYETLFDDFEGLVHLEALEMLSRQVSMRIDERLRTATADSKREIKETLQQVAELCEMPEDDDSEEAPEATGDSFHERLQEATEDLGIKLQFQPLVKQYTDVLDWFSSSEETISEKAVYKFAVSSLAQYTALSVEVYHKAAEMLLVKTRRSTADEADALTQMTSVLTKYIGELATKFTVKLNSISSENKEQINTYITNVFLEAGNSSTYIQNAFHLALPILQIGAV